MMGHYPLTLKPRAAARCQRDRDTKSRMGVSRSSANTYLHSIALIALHSSLPTQVQANSHVSTNVCAGFS